MTISGKNPSIETEIYPRRYVAHKVKCPELLSHRNQTYSVCSECVLRTWIHRKIPKRTLNTVQGVHPRRMGCQWKKERKKILQNGWCGKF